MHANTPCRPVPKTPGQILRDEPTEPKTPWNESAIARFLVAVILVLAAWFVMTLASAAFDWLERAKATVGSASNATHIALVRIEQ